MVYKSLTSAVFLREVGEAPDVAEADRVADGGQDEGDLGVPRLALLAPLVTLGRSRELRHRTEGVFGISVDDIAILKKMGCF